jgi:hypothetical protein
MPLLILHKGSLTRRRWKVLFRSTGKCFDLAGQYPGDIGCLLDNIKMAVLDNSGYCQNRRTLRVPGYLVDFLD